MLHLLHFTISAGHPHKISAARKNKKFFLDKTICFDFIRKESNHPGNQQNANPFFRGGFIEAWGRGIQKIKDSCILAGNDIPDYYVKKEDIMVLFRGLGETPPQSPKTTSRLDEIDFRIIKVIESKPCISQKKIAALVGVSYETVRYRMENRKKREIIVRKGNGRYAERFLHCTPSHNGYRLPLSHRQINADCENVLH